MGACWWWLGFGLLLYSDHDDAVAVSDHDDAVATRDDVAAAAATAAAAAAAACRCRLLLPPLLLLLMMMMMHAIRCGRPQHIGTARAKKVPSGAH